MLTIGSDAVPALAISGYTPLVFDARASTGSALAYRLEFEDGERSTSPLTTHVDAVYGKRTATLTVTDQLGRISTASADYYVATLGRGGGTWWYYRDGPGIRLYLSNNGSTISGVYNGPEKPFGVTWAIEGTLSEQRTVSLSVNGGRISFDGSLEWRSTPAPSFGQSSLRLRLTARGGSLDGQTVEFGFADPY